MALFVGMNANGCEMFGTSRETLIHITPPQPHYPSLSPTHTTTLSLFLPTLFLSLPPSLPLPLSPTHPHLLKNTPSPHTLSLPLCLPLSVSLTAPHYLFKPPIPPQSHSTHSLSLPVSLLSSLFPLYLPYLHLIPLPLNHCHSTTPLPPHLHPTLPHPVHLTPTLSRKQSQNKESFKYAIQDPLLPTKNTQSPLHISHNPTTTTVILSCPL